MGNFVKVIAPTGALIILAIGWTARTAEAGDDDDSSGVEATVGATFAGELLNVELDPVADGELLKLLDAVAISGLLQNILDGRGKSLDDLFNGSGVLDGANNDSQILLAALFLPDPFVAFDATVRNGSDQTERFTLGSILPIDPQISTETFSRAVLDVDLIDANNDGTAEIETIGLINASLSRFQGVTSDNLAPDLTPFPNNLIGTAISGETNGFMRFDTGVVDGPTFDSDSQLIELAPRVEFDLSPGDEVRLRGLYTIDTVESGLLTPEIAFPVLDVLSKIPEPSSLALFALSFVVLLGQRRQISR